MPTDTSLGSIGAYGMTGSDPNLGPFGFLPQEPGINNPVVAANGQSFANYDQSGIAGAGGESLNQMEFGGNASGSSSPAGFSPSSSPVNGGNSAATSYLQGVVSGSNVPYNAQTISAENTQAADMNSQAEGAQNAQATAQAVAGGASGSDPSLAGVSANNEAKRTASNSQAANSINQNASIQNEQAQQSAAQQLQGDAAQQEQLAIEQEQAQWGQQDKQEQMMMSFMNNQANSPSNGTQVGLQGDSNPFTGSDNSGGFISPQGFAPPGTTAQSPSFLNSNSASPINSNNLENQNPNGVMQLPDGTWVNGSNMG